MKNAIWKNLGVVIVFAAASYGLYMMSGSGTPSMGVEGGVVDGGDAVKDIPPSTDLETLPPILRKRAARKVPGEERSRMGRSSDIQSPILLELNMVSVKPFEGEDEGGEVTVDARVRPLVDCADLKWFVRVPEGLSLLSGLSSWRGEVKKEEEKTFRLVISVPNGKPYILYSRAESYLENGDVLTRGADLRIDLGPKDAGENTPFERIDSRGRRVIGYKGSGDPEKRLGGGEK